MSYPVLKFKILERGIRQKVLADALGISVRSLYKRLNGLVPFSWPEVCIIHKRFFPDIEKDTLFISDDDQKPA